MRWYRKAADHGNAKAQNELGVAYYTGEGIDQSYAEALKWYRMAAEQGLVMAQNNLGILYEQLSQGSGPYSYEAHVWYERAAEQGLVQAQENLGRLYTIEGLSQNYLKALEWYQKAADQGSVLGMEGVGKIYGEGLGTAQDYAKAAEYYSRATRASSGDKAQEYAAKADEYRRKAATAVPVSVTVVNRTGDTIDRLYVNLSASSDMKERLGSITLGNGREFKIDLPGAGQYDFRARAKGQDSDEGYQKLRMRMESGTNRVILEENDYYFDEYYWMRD